jgi:surfeit locus 1 family protein
MAHVKTAVGILTAGAVFITLCSLGWWQLERRTWKNNLLQQQEAMRNQPPATLEILNHLSENELEFHPVRAAGELQWKDILWFGPRRENGTIGYHGVVPFNIRSDFPVYGGRYILVNLGFAPQAVREAWQTPDCCRGPITLEGILRQSQHPSWRTARNVPENKFWQILYVEQVASALELKPFLPLTLQVSVLPEELGKSFNALPRSRPLRNNHLQYALTWFLLAGIQLAVMLGLWRRRASPSGTI